MKSTRTSKAELLVVATLLGSLVAGCSYQPYVAKPIDTAQSLAHYRSNDPNGAEFHDYLITQGYPVDAWPIKLWGLRELTLSALYFHPDLNVARAQWRAAQAGEISAGQRPNPGFSGRLENHSRTDGGISPWTYGLAIDITVETAGKREARIDRAVNLSESARIEISQTAWQVRSRLLNSYVDYQNSLQQVELLQKELALRQQIVDMLTARFNAGMVSSVELGNARLQQQRAQQQLDAEKGRSPELRAQLASNAGLPPQAFNILSLQADSSGPFLEQPEAITPAADDKLQDAALLNRLDIRAALARYAAAEAKLRLEIARQYPDLILSPGYTYDQGDHIWSLGVSALLNLLNRNEGLIAEARSLREVEAAQFEALQAKVLGDMEQARARLAAAYDEQAQARRLYLAQQQRSAQIKRQFESGYTDRLELTTTQLESLIAEQNLTDIRYRIQRARAALEDALQIPLPDGTDAPLNNMPPNLEQAIGAQ